MFKNELSESVWLFGIILLALIIISLSLILGIGTKRTATNQVLKQQQTIVKAEASNIASFFQTFGDSVAIVAQLDGIKTLDETSQKDLDTFVDQWRDTGVIGGILVLDKDGIVVLNSNVMGTKDTGTSLEDRDYFQWAKAQTKPGEFFMGKAVVSRTGASKGKSVVVVASPIFVKGNFDGAVVSSIEIQSLTEHYLGLMSVSESTDVYMLGSTGDLLFDGRDSGKIGENVFTQNSPFLGDQKLMDQIKDGLKNAKEGYSQTNNQVVVYSPVVLSGKTWLLIMASPLKDVTDISGPAYIRESGALILIALSVIAFEVVVVNQSWKSKRPLE